MHTKQQPVQEAFDAEVDDVVSFFARELVDLIHKHYQGVVDVDSNSTTYLIGVGALQRTDLSQAVKDRLAAYLGMNKEG